MEYLIFGSVGALCAILFLIMMIFGGDHGGDVHVDTDAHLDFGHFGHDMDAGGNVDISGHDSDFHGGESGMPAIISLRNLLLFGSGFGGVGLIATAFGQGMFASYALAIVSGFAFAYCGWKVFRYASQESNSLVRSRDFIRKPAEVMISIPSDGLGQILTKRAVGRNMYFSARSVNGASIEKGEEVYVYDMLEGGVAVVYREKDIMETKNKRSARKEVL